MAQRLRTLEVKRLFILILFVAILVMAAREITDPDFFWHLRTGQWIWENGSLPRRDPFSYTLYGEPWIAHEWLTEASLYGLYLLGGQEGLILAFALLITSTFLLVYLRCKGKPYLAGFSVLLAALASAVAWGVRPQMVSLFLSALFLYLLQRYREGRSGLLWLLPPLMALWVNLHGGYLLGLALFLAFIVGEAITYLVDSERKPQRGRLVKMGAAFLASGAATLLNPQGWRILAYPFATLASPSMQSYIAEWFSPDFHQIEFQPLAILLLLSFLAFALSQRRPCPTDMLLFIIFAYASLRSARNIPIFAIIAAPILSEQLADVWEGSRLSQRFPLGKGESHPRLLAFNWLILVLALLAGTMRVAVTVSNNESLQRQKFPVAAVDYLEEKGLHERIYNLYHWGGYLLWRLYPQERVYIDGRADLYGDAFIEEYLKAYRGEPGWQEILSEHGVELVLIDRGSGLAAVLDHDRGWQRAYQDEVAVLYKRSKESE